MNINRLKQANKLTLRAMKSAPRKVHETIKSIARQKQERAKKVNSYLKKFELTSKGGFFPYVQRKSK